MTDWIGKLIVIDGPDGGGKTTQIGILRDTLAHRYSRPPEDFVFTREPGGSTFAEQIRALILSEGSRGVSAEIMIQLFGAARFEHLRSTIEPALAEGRIVVTDRFDAATYAYQITAQKGGKEARRLFEMQRALLEEREVFNGRDWTTIILDVEPETGRQRLAERGGEKLNHFDERPLSFHYDVRTGFKHYALKYGPTWTIDTSGRTPCQVHQDIIMVFDQVLGGPNR